MNLEHKSAVGILPDHETAKTAIDRFQEAEIPLNKVTLVARHVEQDDVAISEAQFFRHQTIERLEKGALDGGVFGAASGLLIGLASFLLPGVGAVAFAGARGVALLGMAAGGFYGATGGSLMGAAVGNSMSEAQSNIYKHALLEGKYLVVVEGSDAEIDRAQTILQAIGVQESSVYQML